MTNNNDTAISTNLKLAAQVAVEAVINMPDAYHAITRLAVLFAGEEAGVSDFYLDQLRAIRS